MNKSNKLGQLLQKYLDDFHIDKNHSLTPSEIESIFIKARDDFYEGIISLLELSVISKKLYALIDDLTYEKRTYTASNLNRILDIAGFTHFLLLSSSPALIGYLQALYAYPNYINRTLDQIIGDYLQPYPQLTVDSDLTPENASVKGYEWVCDVMYQIDAMEGTLDHLVNKVTIQGYKLGTPVTRLAANDHQGLYAPLGRNKSH